jgi:hypothetical protein
MNNNNEENNSIKRRKRRTQVDITVQMLDEALKRAKDTILKLRLENEGLKNKVTILRSHLK